MATNNFPARKQKQDTVKQFMLSDDPAPTSHPESVEHTQDSHCVFEDINTWCGEGPSSTKLTGVASVIP